MEQKRMKKIQTTAIIGTGALGMLFGAQMSRTAGREQVYFVLDEDRCQRYQGQTFSINGETLDLNFRRSSEMEPVDLVVVAVKYNSLPGALETMKHCVGPDTTIISVLNGIDSESIIGARFGREKLIDTVAQGMDAMRDGSSLRYTQMGKLFIGVSQGQSPEKLAALTEYFRRTGTPFQVEENISYRMWAKWMLNVGVNQTCMAYDTTYAGVLVEGSEENERFVGAMREVIALSRLEGVDLPDSEIDVYIRIIRTLDPEGYPSMAQDRKAGRRTEVEMFAGMVRRLAAKHGLPVPHNDALYQRVKELEAALPEGR